MSWIWDITKKREKVKKKSCSYEILIMLLLSVEWRSWWNPISFVCKWTNSHVNPSARNYQQQLQEGQVHNQPCLTLLLTPVEFNFTITFVSTYLKLLIIVVSWCFTETMASTLRILWGPVMSGEIFWNPFWMSCLSWISGFPKNYLDFLITISWKFKGPVVTYTSFSQCAPNLSSHV